MSDWAKILEAVKEPISLAALSLLVLMAVLRQVLKKIAPMAGKHGYKLALSSVTVVGVLSFVVAGGAIGYKFYELRTTSSYRAAQLENQSKLEQSKIAAAQARPRLTRLDMENLVQKHRSSIEDCLRERSMRLYYLDFGVRNQEDGQLNVDILGGIKTGFAVIHPIDAPAGITSKNPAEGWKGYPTGDTYFVTGDMPDYPQVTAASARKLGVVAPEVNRCVLDVIRDSIFSYAPPERLFTHRYITNAGIRASREYRGVFSEKIYFALLEGRFDDASRIEKEAVTKGYAITDNSLIQRTQLQFRKLKAGQINKDEYERLLTDSFSRELLQ